MSRLVGEESPLGWARTALVFLALALLPVWGLLTVFVLYAEYDMELSLFWIAGLVSAVLVLEAAGVVAALLLSVRGAMRLVTLLQDRSAARRYTEVVGDGAVLRPDAWGPDVLEGGEE